MHTPPSEHIPTTSSDSACASCFYWVNGIGCCREGAVHFRSKLQVSACDTYRREPYVPFAQSNVWNSAAELLREKGFGGASVGQAELVASGM